MKIKFVLEVASSVVLVWEFFTGRSHSVHHGYPIVMQYSLGDTLARN